MKTIKETGSYGSWNNIEIWKFLRERDRGREIKRKKERERDWTEILSFFR